MNNKYKVGDVVMAFLGGKIYGIEQDQYGHVTYKIETKCGDKFRYCWVSEVEINAGMDICKEKEV
jgi:hypothetical protein